MKGHIFNLLEQFIVEVSSEETYEEILESCEFITQEPFVRPGSYPDEDLAEIVNKTVEKLGISLKDAHYGFGKWIFPHLMKMAPPEVLNYQTPKEILLALDYIHMVEVKKVIPDAEPPRFYCTDTGPNTLDMVYSSPRGMFDIVDGVLASLEEYYSAKIEYSKEMDDSGPFTICKYKLTFPE